jgi:hypothetical protein
MNTAGQSQMLTQSLYRAFAICSILTATQIRAWTRHWRLEFGFRKLTTVFRTTFSRRKRLVSKPVPYPKTGVLEPWRVAVCGNTLS